MSSRPSPTKTADLGTYISRSHPPLNNRNSLSSLDRIFDRGLFHFPPRLHQGRVNRILLFPGCFNPPHVAHETLLRQTFLDIQDAGDLNLIAAIVLPLDDERLTSKCRGAGCTTTTTATTSGSNALVLTKAQRVCLWKGGWRAVPSDWRWVYDGSEAEWEGFRERLVGAVRRDGFELEFICLVGADYVRRGSAWLPWGDWGCDGIVVGEVGRSADFVAAAPTGSGRERVKLYRLRGCEEWEVVREDIEAAYRRATDRVVWFAGAWSIVSLDTLRRRLDQGKLTHLSRPELFSRALLT
jgi:hypothetical protein